MGVMEKIKEIEAEMARTQKNKAVRESSREFFVLRTLYTVPVVFCLLPSALFVMLLVTHAV